MCHIFSAKKFQHICVSLDLNFSESLTNDVVSFEQLGPDILSYLDEALIMHITRLGKKKYLQKKKQKKHKILILFFFTIGATLKGKNLHPPGANSFL